MLVTGLQARDLMVNNLRSKVTGWRSYTTW